MVIDHLEQALLDADFNTFRADGPAVRFYASNTLLTDHGGHRLLSVRSGGQNRHPFVECKGAASDVVAKLLRSGPWEHAPARIDSAIDRSGPDLFDQLNRLALRYEADFGVKLDRDGADLTNPDRGSTIYLGSRKSQAFVRIYQKGLKHAEEMGLVGDAIPDELRHWVRIELEYKPDKRPARMKAARLSPRALWGCSPWTQRFATDALSIEAKRVHMTERRESNQERAMRFLIQQYGPTIRKQVELLGGWDRLADDLQERLGGLEPA
jgi:hypothetical protein